MENCSNCRWRKDLIKLELIDNHTVKTRQEGYACLASALGDDIVWFVNQSEFNTVCEMFAPKGEQ